MTLPSEIQNLVVPVVSVIIVAIVVAYVAWKERK
jgi:hypothetical protein